MAWTDEYGSYLRNVRILPGLHRHPDPRPCFRFDASIGNDRGDRTRGSPQELTDWSPTQQPLRHADRRHSGCDPEVHRGPGLSWMDAAVPVRDQAVDGPLDGIHGCRHRRTLTEGEHPRDVRELQGSSRHRPLPDPVALHTHRCGHDAVFIQCSIHPAHPQLVRIGGRDVICGTIPSGSIGDRPLNQPTLAIRRLRWKPTVRSHALRTVVDPIPPVRSGAAQAHPPHHESARHRPIRSAIQTGVRCVRLLHRRSQSRRRC
jgi:hypothetical protein